MIDPSCIIERGLLCKHVGCSGSSRTLGLGVGVGLGLGFRLGLRFRLGLG